MKKIIVTLLIVIAFSSLFAGIDGKFSAEIAAKIDISKKSNSKISFDGLEVWEKVKYDSNLLGSFEEKVEYNYLFDSKRDGFCLSVIYSNNVNTVLGDLSFGTKLLFNMPRINGKLVKESIQPILNFSLNNKKFDENAKSSGYLLNLSIGYKYSFDKILTLPGLVSEISLSYNNGSNTVKGSACGIFHLVDGKLKIEDGSVGVQLLSGISYVGFETGVEYRHSYNAGPEVNGIYLYLTNFTVQGLFSLKPIESTLPENLGMDFVVSVHKLENHLLFDINKIYIPCTVKFFYNLDSYGLPLNGQASFGLDTIEYRYDYDNTPDENGFFITFDSFINFDLTGKSTITVFDDFVIKPTFRERKLRADLFLDFGIKSTMDNY